jgi:hypothetical protein
MSTGVGRDARSACTTIGQCIRPRWTGSVDTTKGPLTRGSRSFAPRPGQTGEGPRACGGHDEALRTRCRRVTAPPNSIGCRSSAACSRCHALVLGHARRRDPTVRTPRPRPGPARTTRLTAARTRQVSGPQAAALAGTDNAHRRVGDWADLLRGRQRLLGVRGGFGSRPSRGAPTPANAPSGSRLPFIAPCPSSPAAADPEAAPPESTNERLTR